MPLNQARRKRNRNPGLIDGVLRSSDVDTFTKSLLHLNGTHGSTTITDVIAGKTWTATGAAALSTVQKKFGTASLLITNSANNTNYISTPNHVDFQLGTSDFTMETSLRFVSIGAGTAVPLFTKRAPANESFTAQYVPGTLELRFNWSSDGSLFLGPANFALSNPLSIDQWYHIMFVRVGATLMCFLDGQKLSPDYNIGTTSIFGGTAMVQIGSSSSPSYTFSVYFDEIRFSKGIARQTANFVPPTVEYY